MDLGKLSDGRLFSVVFKKRTDGSLRRMVCRTGVRKHLRGGEQPYDPAAKNLMTVFDVQRRGYRTIPLDRIVQVEHHGRIESGPLYGEVQHDG